MKTIILQDKPFNIWVSNIQKTGRSLFVLTLLFSIIVCYGQQTNTMKVFTSASEYVETGNMMMSLATSSGLDDKAFFDETLDDAIGYFDKAIKISPNYTKAYKRRGLAKYFRNDLKGALADYNMVIKLDPKDAEAYMERANTKVDLDDNTGAMADYNMAIKLDPEYEEAYFYRGLFKHILEDARGAITDYNMAIKLKPDNAQAYSMRGRAKGLLGDNKEQF